MRILGAVCCLALAWPGLASAEDRCWATLGALETRGEVKAVAVAQGGVAVALLDHEVLVVDIRNPADPRLAAQVRTPGHPVDVAISGSRAFVLQYDFGLQVLDFSEPERSVLVGTFTTSCAGQAIEIADDTAYLACFRDGLKVVDIEKPSGMEEIGSVDTPGMAYDVAVVGDRVYVADFTSGLRVIDVGRPKKPRETSAFEVLRRAVAVAAEGDFAYVVDGRDGVSVIDVSDVDAPEEVALVEALDKTTRLGASITIADGLLYVVDDRWFSAQSPACRRVRRWSRLRSGSPPCGGVWRSSCSGDLGHLGLRLAPARRVLCVRACGSRAPLKENRPASARRATGGCPAPVPRVPGVRRRRHARRCATLVLSRGA
jgi:DNA-binding beta-propeller fold protein YncE